MMRYRAWWPGRAFDGAVRCREELLLLGKPLTFDSPEEGTRQLRLTLGKPTTSPYLAVALDRGDVTFEPVDTDQLFLDE